MSYSVSLTILSTSSAYQSSMDSSTLYDIVTIISIVNYIE